jgi:ribonuclease HI
VNLNKKPQGRTPITFLDIIHKLTGTSQIESESDRDLLQPKHQPNPFKQWHNTSHYTTKELKDNNMDWVLQVNTSNPIIGKVRKRNSTTTTFRHYNTNDTQSPLVPCPGCHKCKHKDNRGDLCISEANNTDLISIPVKHTTISGRKTKDTRTLRTLVSPNSIHTIINSTNRTEQPLESIIIPETSQPPYIYWTNNNKFKETLNDLHQKSKNWRDIKITTDGGTGPNFHTIAFIIQNTETEENTGTTSFKIKNKASALKAELTAIITALSTLNKNSKVTINTDSTSAINTITKSKSKSKQRTLGKIINTLTQDLNLSITYLHTKRRSNNTLTKVDEATKSAKKNWNIIDLNIRLPQAQQLYFTLDNKPITQNIREAIKEMFQRKHITEWCCLERNHKHIEDFKEIDWKSSTICSQTSKITSGATNQ